jgi:8-oxo-dGTP pyrophosphatase MutT (NUDIX family)
MAEIKNALAAYMPTDIAEQRFKVRMLQLLIDEPRPFWRDSFSPGHFTGSALVMNRRRDNVLLLKHANIGRWMQFGGHADGARDLLGVAVREASEESGFPEEAFVFSGGIFDIDIHPILANLKRREPAHEHFDVRYLLELDDVVPLPANPEGLTVRWFPLEEAVNIASGDEGLMRLLTKVAS